MIEWKDITDVLVAPIVAALGWTIKSINDKPSRDEVQRMIDINNNINKALIDSLKNDILELKDDIKETKKDVKELRDLVIKSFSNK